MDEENNILRLKKIGIDTYKEPVIQKIKNNFKNKEIIINRIKGRKQQFN